MCLRFSEAHKHWKIGISQHKLVSAAIQYTSSVCHKKKGAPALPAQSSKYGISWISFKFSYDKQIDIEIFGQCKKYNDFLATETNM